MLSELDTKRFGLPIAKVNDWSEGVDTLLDRCRALGIKLVMSRIDSREIDLINQLEDRGFRLKDTQLTVSKRLMAMPGDNFQISIPDDITVGHVMPSEAERVGDLAYEAFKGYGHYAQDTRLDINQSNEIYRDWAVKSCLDRSVADFVFVTRVEGNVAGFLSLKCARSEEGSYGIQHFGAVDSKYRNRSLFRMLIARCMEEGFRLGHTRQETYLLSINAPVLGSYTKMGYRILGSHHTLHGWIS